MTALDTVFDEDVKLSDHPLLKYIDRTGPEKVEVEVQRPQDVLGYKPVKLFVHLTVKGTVLPPQEYSWDDDLNHALGERGYRAISAESEKLRFALALRAGFRKAESRFGDGYFNSVLRGIVLERFGAFPEVADVMRDVSTNPPFMDGQAFGDCSEMLVNVLRGRAKELTAALSYGRDVAEEILAGAVARYMDERFTVSDRRRLGWT